MDYGWRKEAPHSGKTMILERGNMWEIFGKTDLFLITTNPIVRADGAVVMGRGIAKQAKERFPELPYKFAVQLRHAQKECDWMSQNIGMIGRYGGQMVGWFMVKDHWKNPASLPIIERSVIDLALHDKWMWVNRIDLNFPGIGNGKLKREDVLPLIERLPNNVHVWEYDEPV